MENEDMCPNCGSDPCTCTMDDDTDEEVGGDMAA
ncbi:MAG: hypothetical protein UV70_C0003G0035 [Parcubacteria group bacterium GW2011_GWA2_43_13]|nr:MAG: hypothetical protein UV70_C0003G0035 [Parcubacteria group bacterium GW2011_GWA2_43_13]